MNYHCYQLMLYPIYLHESGLFSGGLEDIINSSSLRGNEGLQSCLIMDLGHTEEVRGKQLDSSLACKSPLS